MGCLKQIVCCMLFSGQHFAISLQKPQRPLCEGDWEGTSVSTIVKNVAMEVMYNDSGHFVFCRPDLWNDHEGVAGSTLAGCSWMFCRKPFEQGVVVCYYYCSNLYADLCRRQNSMLTYCRSLMETTKETFQKWAIHIHEKVLDKDEV